MTERPSSEVESVTVVGAGSMGHGIAQVFAATGHKVSLVDVFEDILEEALENVEASLRQLGTDPEPVLDRIATTTDRREGLAGADLMVEAVPEDIDIKSEVFADASEVTPERAVLATNTSSLPVSEIAASTDRPEDVVGMHFSNPVPLIPIVEVVRGEATSAATFALAEAVSEALDKTPILVKKDVPGFVLNRINYAFWNEALRPVDAGEFDPATIDAALQRLDFPMGPFEVLDFAGLDVFHMVCEAMQERGVPGEVSPTLSALIDAEKYGMKTGEGFYEYPGPGEYERVDVALDRRYEYDPYSMLACAANEAAWLVDNEVASRADVDRAMEIGMNWPRGPLRFADEYGIDRVLQRLESLSTETGSELFEPDPLLESMVETGRLGVKVGEGFYEYPYEADRIGGVCFERRDWWAHIEVLDPDARDDIRAVWDGLAEALGRAERADGIRAMVLSGLGEAFAGRPELAAMAEWETEADVTDYYESAVEPAVETLLDHPLPVVAVAEDDIVDTGCELFAICDLGVAPSGARVRLRATAAGMVPPIWVTHGRGRVDEPTLFEIAATSTPVSTDEVAAAGLFNHAVPDDQVADVARELARAATAGAPSALAELKTLLAGGDSGDPWQAATAAAAEHTQSEAGRHGLRAFHAGDRLRWER
jgi:enoyl-CoA hydratase/3-hydroxyacyl-CoA dehydrogenase